VVAWIVGLAALTAVALLVAWLAGWLRFGTDPRVKEILDLQEQARQRYAQKGGPTNLADATAAATSMMEIRQRVEQLPPHLRPQVEQAGGNMFRAAFRERIDRYFALPPQQRQAEIDRQIDQDEMMRKAFEAGSAVMGAFGGGQGSGGQGAGGQAGAGQQGPGQPPGRGPWGSQSEEERNRWRKSMIDRTTPQERARYTEYRRNVDARREQRGLPSMGPR
jgi:hypothetical protein